ncbi:MAG TPA: acyltransferase [Myxococcales bacterium]|nr:acyltransferase [Myxococcales bacterium]
MSLRTALWLRRCRRRGARIRLVGRPVLLGSGDIEIGDDVEIVSSPVPSHFLAAGAARLEVGDGVRIGHGAAISALGHVRIGAGARLGPFCVVSDSDFHEVGDRAVRPKPRPVIIGKDVRIGSRVTVLPGSTIGDGARIEAGSTVGGHIPAGTHAAGVPALPVRAAGVPGVHPVHDAADGDDLQVSVPRLVMRALGLSRPPEAQSGPDQIEQWDSLGSLKLLASLEEEFQVSLQETELANARCVADLVAAVDAARRRAIGA